ncbi:MAG: hypothetical protein COV31_00770 [Candidatus Yanofskybacteria bacterium CG10_big_fil_rev_8_21_14_0_10_46_23]|uniref:Uncharacterized protein n=1 Tax=Candidatus Yanofskybacteria bacterium CG10_big_fil_rev_8_21_14_0_10_46_23 TaxID=1975098 RepID=A0A2H0R4J5_9BACT|nr:MAG: hypothetical protein COV31_00770 [Candidatus Yanofskybacteria bacterium CG10_big_fil_rev_8_21_14_0_10_46_23]
MEGIENNDMNMPEKKDGGMETPMNPNMPEGSVEEKEKKKTPAMGMPADMDEDSEEDENPSGTPNMDGEAKPEAGM